MRRKTYRTVVMYRHYFGDFYSGLNKRARLKVDWTIQLIETTERVPSKFLKYLVSTDGLYEMRVLVGRDAIRIFCFFDHNRLIVLINFFEKKKQKTPRRELERALRIKREYYDEEK